MITVIEGATGSGKSWFMARLAYKAWGNMADVYANFTLKFSDKNEGVARWHNLDEIYHLHHGVILIDEAVKLFDARRWASLPVAFAEKIAQHRHHFLDILTATQDFSHIDVRVRQNVHVRYICQSHFRLPSEERGHPFLQIISITKKIREHVSDTEQLRWKLKKKRYHLISRFWTKTLYDSYANLSTEQYICKLKLNQKQWTLQLYSREMVDRGKARI